MNLNHSDWRPVGNVKLQNNYLIERCGDKFRVTTATSQGAEYRQLIEEEIIRHLGRTLQGQTVTVDEAEKILLGSRLHLPYRHGYKLHFFAQQSLVTLVACGRASHGRVGKRFEYHVKR